MVPQYVSCRELGDFYAFFHSILIVILGGHSYYCPRSWDGGRPTKGSTVLLKANREVMTMYDLIPVLSKLSDKALASYFKSQASVKFMETASSLKIMKYSRQESIKNNIINTCYPA